jgi:hypothetical protein
VRWLHAVGEAIEGHEGHGLERNVVARTVVVLPHDDDKKAEQHCKDDLRRCIDRDHHLIVEVLDMPAYQAPPEKHAQHREQDGGADNEKSKEE